VENKLAIKSAGTIDFTIRMEAPAEIGILVMFQVYNGLSLFDQTVVQKVVWSTKDDKGTTLKTRQFDESCANSSGKVVELAVKSVSEA